MLQWLFAKNNYILPLTVELTGKSQGVRIWNDVVILTNALMVLTMCQEVL